MSKVMVATKLFFAMRLCLEIAHRFDKVTLKPLFDRRYYRDKPIRFAMDITNNDLPFMDLNGFSAAQIFCIRFNAIIFPLITMP